MPSCLLRRCALCVRAVCLFPEQSVAQGCQPREEAQNDLPQEGLASNAQQLLVDLQMNHSSRLSLVACPVSCFLCWSHWLSLPSRVRLMATLALCTYLYGWHCLSSHPAPALFCGSSHPASAHFLHLSSLLGSSLLCPQNTPYVSYYQLKAFL